MASVPNAVSLGDVQCLSFVKKFAHAFEVMGYHDDRSSRRSAREWSALKYDGSSLHIPSPYHSFLAYVGGSAIDVPYDLLLTIVHLPSQVHYLKTAID